MTIKKRAAPYRDTDVSPDKSRAQIDQLLRDFGATGTRWSTLWDKNRVELEFGVEHDGKRTVVRIIAPTFMARHRTWNAKLGRNEEVEAPNWPQSFRLLYHWVKAKLEAVTWGLRAFEEEFLADTVVQTPRGDAVRVAEILMPAIESGRLDVPALEGGRRLPADRSVVDVEDSA